RSVRDPRKGVDMRRTIALIAGLLAFAVMMAGSAAQASAAGRCVKDKEHKGIYDKNLGGVDDCLEELAGKASEFDLVTSFTHHIAGNEWCAEVAAKKGYYGTSECNGAQVAEGNFVKVESNPVECATIEGAGSSLQKIAQLTVWAPKWKALGSPSSCL